MVYKMSTISYLPSGDQLVYEISHQTVKMSFEL